MFCKASNKVKMFCKVSNYLCLSNYFVKCQIKSALQKKTYFAKYREKELI